MKKIIVFLFCLIIILGINNKDDILIPKEAIRFRIIANSDDLNDQKLKLTIKSDIEKELFNIVNDAKTISEARNIIKNNLDTVKNIMNKYNVTYDINYGYNYFPKKEFRGIQYKDGNYESLVITLGNGLGNNWWCVLFPPLCLLDQNENIDNANYKLYVKEIINKYK